MAWLPIETAPKDGTPIRIRGRRFQTETRYTATAIWATRRCPAEVTDWFPPTDNHDGHGPYVNVDGWKATGGYAMTTPTDIEREARREAIKIYKGRGLDELARNAFVLGYKAGWEAAIKSLAPLERDSAEQRLRAAEMDRDDARASLDSLRSYFNKLYYDHKRVTLLLDAAEEGRDAAREEAAKWKQRCLEAERELYDLAERLSATKEG